MADKNLVQHVDKISYAVAAVLGLVVLILPILSGGNLAETRSKLNEAVENLKRKKAEQRSPPLPDLDLEDSIEAQWRPGTSLLDPTWITEAAPCLVKRAKSVQKRPATHAPGVITEISAHRDAERKQVYLVVKGAMSSKNEFVTIDKVKLLRRVGASGSFVEVATFDGDFEYTDYDVEAGQLYAYKFETEASRQPDAPTNILPPENTMQESSAVETPPIPYDFSVKVRQTFRATQLGERPSVMARFKYWDYAAGQEAGEDRGRYTEKDVIGGRYQISFIDPQKRTIDVKDGIRLKKYEGISSKDDPFSLELWAPVSGVEEASAEDTAADDEIQLGGDEPAVEKEAPAEPEEKKPGGFRRFPRTRF